MYKTSEPKYIPLALAYGWKGYWVFTAYRVSCRCEGLECEPIVRLVRVICVTDTLEEAYEALEEGACQES